MLYRRLNAQTTRHKLTHIDQIVLATRQRLSAELTSETARMPMLVESEKTRVDQRLAASCN